MLKLSFRPNILRGQGVLNVKGSMFMLCACQLISSCSFHREAAILSEITMEKDFVPLLMISKILDLSVC